MADAWTAVIVSAAALAAAGILLVVLLGTAPETSRPTSGFPYCLRVLQCSNVPEFRGIPFDEMITIAKNYDACFEDYKIEQTCNVQVFQDIERFHELGYVGER